MKRKLLGALVGVAVALVAAESAVAGSSSLSPVVLGTVNGLQTAKGSLRDARDSADNVQFIGCSVYAYDSNPESHTTVCTAKDAAGTFRACGADSAEMRQLAADATASLNAASYVYFVINADGSCAQVAVVHRSIYL
jgi:hypothetical protein